MNISSIEEGNKFAETFRLKYNKKFAKEPALREDVHSLISSSQNLDEICMIQEYRKVAKDLSFNYKGIIYQIDSEYSRRMWGKTVQVYEVNEHVKMVMFDGKKLKYKKYRENIAEPTKIVGTKELEVIWPTFGRKPKKYHPWR